MTKRRTATNPISMQHNIRIASGRSGKVPVAAKASKNVVDAIYHQLFRGLSFANAFERACKDLAGLGFNCAESPKLPESSQRISQKKGADFDFGPLQWSGRDGLHQSQMSALCRDAATRQRSAVLSSLQDQPVKCLRARRWQRHLIHIPVHYNRAIDVHPVGVDQVGCGLQLIEGNVVWPGQNQIRP